MVYLWQLYTMVLNKGQRPVIQQATWGIRPLEFQQEIFISCWKTGMFPAAE